MSEKSKKSTSKKTTAKKPTTKSTTKKTKSKKAPPKKTTATTKKKQTTTAKKPATKKSATKTTTKKPTTATKPRSRKLKIIKAQILSYRRNNRLQTTNQAIAKILDDYNHKALIGKKFVLEFPDSDATAKGVVTAIHGKIGARQVRIRFDKAGMSAYALNLIGDIHI